MLKILLQRFAVQPRYAFAYGSAVFRQANHGLTPNTMVDLILAVDDPVSFHEANLHANRSDYSVPFQILGARAISFCQEWGAGLFYNTMVQVPVFESGIGPTSTFIKYGVISTAELRRDLRLWTSLYAAGRMQKPIFVLQDDAEIRELCRQNLRAAAAASLMLQLQHQPRRKNGSAILPLSVLLEQLVRLSYDGDIRMRIAEAPQKVQNIVAGATRELLDLYLPILQSMPGVVVGEAVAPSSSPFQLVADRSFCESWARMLPPPYQEIRADPSSHEFADELRRRLRSTVFRSSTVQTLKGVATAGPAKSIIYLLEKMRKRLGSFS